MKKPITFAQQSRLIEIFSHEKSDPRLQHQRRNRLRTISTDFKESTGGVLLNSAHCSKWVMSWTKKSTKVRVKTTTGQMIETWGLFVEWCFQQGLTDDNVHRYIKPKSWYGRGLQLPSITLTKNLQRHVDKFLDLERNNLSTSINKTKCILLNFNGFLNSKPNAGDFDQIITPRTVQSWLYSVRDRVTARTGAEMLKTLENFFRFLIEEKVLSTNPATELATKYNRQGKIELSERIMRGMDLGALRSDPLFVSSFSEELQRYILHKRNFGQYKTLPFQLKSWDQFLARRYSRCRSITPAMFREWQVSLAGESQRNRLDKTRYVRNFCQFVNRDKNLCFGESYTPKTTNKHYFPHLFSRDDFRRVLKQSRLLMSDDWPLIEPSFRMMFLLGFTTGIRPCELTKLRFKDFDSSANTLFVEKTKHYKSRYIPLSASVSQHLSSYLSLRESAGASPASDSPLFWNFKSRSRSYAVDSLTKRFALLVSAAGIKPNNDNGRIRLYDLRHSFCVHRVYDWYREGKTIDVMLPVLATYLGHKNIGSTIYYLKRNQPILEEASKRFAAYIKDTESSHA